MQAGNSGMLPRAALATVVVVVLLAIIAVFSASLVAGTALVGGIVLPALVFLLLARWGRERSATTLRLATIVVSALVVGAIALTVAVLAHPPRSYPNALVATAQSYSVTIRPAEAGKFSVTEEASVEVETLGVITATQPSPVTRVRTARTVAATSEGWLLQEVSFSPLADVQVSLPDGTKVTPLFLADFGAKLSARLQDMATGSVYAVKYAQGLASSSYVDTQTLTWSVPDLQESIPFAYIPSPWHNLRPLLAPFLSLSSLSQWVVGILGMVGGTVFGAFVQPPLVAWLRERLAPWIALRLKRGKPPAPEAPAA